MQGIDVGFFPAAEDVIGLGGDSPKCLPVGQFSDLREAVALYPAVLRMGVDVDIALGGEAAEDLRHTGLPGFENRRQTSDRPRFTGQAGQMIEDDELGLGQAGAPEGAIHPCRQALLRHAEQVSICRDFRPAAVDSMEWNARFGIAGEAWSGRRAQRWTVIH